MRYLPERVFRCRRVKAASVRRAVPFTGTRLVSAGPPEPCLHTESPRSPGQITGLQIGSRRETKGFVLFLEPGKNRESFCEKIAELVIVQLLFFSLEVFLHVPQATERLREWTHHLCYCPPTHTHTTAGPSDSIWKCLSLVCSSHSTRRTS